MATLGELKPNTDLIPATVVTPVPPFATGMIPVTFAADPLMLPITFDPLTPTILGSVTEASAIFAVIIALLATTGSAAVTAKSPAN